MSHPSPVARHGIDNLDGWLTTVVSRICLDTLKAGSTRWEHPIDEVPETIDAEEPDFGVLFDEVAPIVATSTANARQLATARRRGSSPRSTSPGGYDRPPESNRRPVAWRS